MCELVELARVPRLRTMRQFAEQEIILPPGGPFGGRKFLCDRMPWTGLFFDAIDSALFNIASLVAIRQGGKTLNGWVIPTMYHLFELHETVIDAVPTAVMAMDKWVKDLKPAIEGSRYANLLPSEGAGSRGGEFDSIVFKNGVALKFMTGGGQDKSRQGYTSRVVAATEVDGMDQAIEGSEETDKLSQIYGCTRAFGRNARIYEECTATIEKGRIWRGYVQGTQSRIACKCPHCSRFVSPEREHLVGWQDAESDMDAARKAHFTCPGCGAAWSESDRLVANQLAKLVHRGQIIDDFGNIQGPAPDTNALGFRVSAVNNLFVDAGTLGADEWKAARKADTDKAEREMLQYVWAMPHKPDSVELTQLDAADISRRVLKGRRRGEVPDDALFLTFGSDQGQRLCHWVCIAWRPGATPHIVDYGRQEVPSDDIGIERGLLVALRDMRDHVIGQGWKTSNGVMRPKISFLDRGWQPRVVTSFCEESGAGFVPCFGLGGRRFGGQVGEKRDTGTEVLAVKDGYLITTSPTSKVYIVEINADHWKTWSNSRLQTPLDQPGSLTLFDAPANEHLAIAKHFLAEKKFEEFVPGKGTVTRWQAVSRSNHWNDALALACVAGAEAGAKLIESPKGPAPKPKARRESSWMSGRPKWK